jgi:hypothetical protein
MLLIRSKILMNKRRMLAGLLLAFPVALTAFSLVGSKADKKVRVRQDDSSVFAAESGFSAHLDAQRITIRPEGFEPAEIFRPAGRFLLAVNDRSGARDLVLTLARDNGQRLHRTRMRDTPRKHQWRQIVNLPPGRYVLSEANHPEWVCRITLTAN